MRPPVGGQGGRFHDGGTPTQPPDPGAPARVLLERRFTDGQETWAMLRRIAYDDRRLGELLVPADLGSFTSDLTSVPSVLTWLVPRTGAHLPAALVHDGLVGPADDGAPAYVSAEGHVVDRVEADRVFRDAMADTGTGVVRRWLAWSAVTLVTLLGRDQPWPAWRRWRYRLAVLGSLLLVVWLGWCATWDILDRSAPAAPGAPWIPEGSVAAELLAGAAGALVVPLLLALTWGRFRVAGAVLGTGLAFLLHVTVVVAALSALAWAAEALVARAPQVAAALTTLVVAAAAVVLAVALLR